MRMARMLVVLAVVGMLSGWSLAHDGHEGHDHGNGKGKLSAHDQLKIAVQEICPMTGNKLGTHGTPLKVKLGEETLFLCCKGCLKQQVNPKHWATIHANFARAQHICPIMKKPLPKNPKWTFINGNIIYVCCPPCAKKLGADPLAATKKLDELYMASLRARQPRR